jgi:hypothetical protein
MDTIGCIDRKWKSACTLQFTERVVGAAPAPSTVADKVDMTRGAIFRIVGQLENEVLGDEHAVHREAPPERPRCLWRGCSEFCTAGASTEHQ